MNPLIALSLTVILVISNTESNPLHIRKIYKKMSQPMQQGDLHTSLKFLRIIQTIHWLESVTHGKNIVPVHVVVVCTYTCVRIRVYVCVVCVCMCVYVYLCVYVYVCVVCMCMCVCLCVCVFVCLFLCMCVCFCVYMHNYDDLCIV